ncbi:hypothetical protein STFR1_20787 [Bacillus vallismortis]
MKKLLAANLLLMDRIIYSVMHITKAGSICLNFIYTVKSQLAFIKETLASKLDVNKEFRLHLPHFHYSLSPSCWLFSF